MNQSKRLYFEKYYKLYEETEITVKELKCKLYSDTKKQKKLGITQNMVDGFWTALMDGVYDIERTIILPQSYTLY